MSEAYKYLRWLSLDIVLGAIFFLAYLGKYYQINIGYSTYWALGSAIWLIYTTDHLMDAAKTVNPISARHAFHKTYFTDLVMVSGLVLILSLINLWFLDIKIIRSGAVLSAIAIAYLMLVYFVKKLWIKEVLVAVVYAVGVFLAPLNAAQVQMIDILLVMELAGIALVNLLVFSYLDFEADQKDGFSSLVIKLGKVKANQLILSLTCGMLFGVAILFFLTNQPIQAMYGAMTLILGTIHFWPAPFLKRERFRTVGDGIFYLPALFLLF